MIKCRAWDGGFIDIPKDKLELRLSAYGIIFHNDKILVVRENNSLFSFPGGGIDANEFIEEGLKREIKEETGLDVMVKEMLYFKEDMFYYNPLNQAIHGILLYYKCEVKNYILKSTNKGEIPLWVDVSKLSKNSFFGVNAEIFNRVKKYKK
ncbi:MAG: NUDIX hydrolase [Candidatus Gracilibacteria bacterium]|jgi:8-oxo-dGTP pyrophosphatase MutT (NUDIX family)